MKTRKNRRQRGWVLLTTLFILLALTIAVTAFYTETEDHLYTGVSLKSYQTAAARAEMGAQDALAKLRQGTFVVGSGSLPTPCDDVNSDPFINGSCVKLGPGLLAPIDNGTARSLTQGGGLQYTYIIYRPAMLGNPLEAAANLYSIRAIGYYGYAGSPNIYTSVVELTTEVGASKTGGCTGAGDYGC